MDMAWLKNEVATLTCETAVVEFKSGLDPSTPRFWPLLIRTVIAMHNCGGGVIVFGLDSQGRSADTNLGAIRSIDPVEVSNKAKHYTDQPLPNVTRHEFEKNGSMFPGWVVPSGAVPVPFSRHGDVHNGQSKPEKVFYAGQVYVRRGASSVPADARDMLVLVERIRAAAQREVFSQIGQLAALPPGHNIQVIPPGSVISRSAPVDAVRITTAAEAPSAIVLDKFKTHCHTRREALKGLLTRIPAARLTTFDLQAVRAVHGDELRELDLIYEPEKVSPRYPDAFCDWAAERYRADPEFFTKAKAAYKANQPKRGRRHAPGRLSTP